MGGRYRLEQAMVRLRLEEAEPLYSRKPIECPGDAVETIAHDMAGMAEEHAAVINLDNVHRPLNYTVISIGDMNQACIPLKSVFKAALLSNASKILMMHNHPGGTAEPSSADLEVTRRVAEAGKLMDMGLLDHVIVLGTTGKFISIREEHPELFSEDT